MPYEVIQPQPDTIAHCGSQFKTEPFRSAREYHATLGIEMATSFAEACNMHSLRRLEAMLSPAVCYTSYWVGRRIRGRDSVVRWFAKRFFWRADGQRY